MLKMMGELPNDSGGDEKDMDHQDYSASNSDASSGDSSSNSHRERYIYNILIYIGILEGY